VYAATHEMAVTLDDVLNHRTRARLLARDASAEAAEVVADLLGDVLGWTADERAAQIAAYRDEIARERDALELAAAPGVAAERSRPPGWAPGLRLPRALGGG
jgi:glycerol-3-phosphate dehydrogenase